MRMHLLFVGMLLAVVISAPRALPGQSNDSPVRWAFSREQNANPIDAGHGIKSVLEGKYTYVPGVSGDALRLDGYTTSMTVAAKDLPAAGLNGFTVEAWVALNTYPWNWVPIVDQQTARRAGFFFGIDAFGHVAMEASIDGQWRSAVSTTTVPLKRWVHLAGTYQTDQGRGSLTVYMNGTALAQLHVEGGYSPAKADLLVGRVREATVPFPEAEVKPRIPIWYSLDGMLDELTLYSSARNEQQIAQDYAQFTAPKEEALPWQRMPSGPARAGRFGAYYSTLKYQDAWDRLRQIGPESDVVVRFDNSPSRLVFWQGLNYIPAWVSGDDKWYTDEFLEVWDAGCPDGGDCEPMSDKQGRFSHVEILESNQARVVVHWRYALVEAVHLKAAWHEPRTGWTDWADEYWTVYPDGVAVRKQVLHSANVKAIHEWQETIVLHQPGSRPEDDINSEAITLGNLQGVTKTYTWRTKPEGVFADPIGPADVSTPEHANMQLVNIKSAWKPFQIVPPPGVSSDFYNNEKSYFQFECWNHWPVAQIASSDRPCVTNDRPSHSSLSHLFWQPYAQTEDSATKILLDGLTTKALPDLVPLAKSWISPPRLQIQSAGYRSEGYDPTQRAYVLDAEYQNVKTLRMVVNATGESPLSNAAILIQNWGDRTPRMSIDGKPVLWDKTYRAALIHRLDSSDLLIWIEKQSTAPVQLTIAADEHARR